MARRTRAEAREEVLAAARRRFAASGYRGTSIADIAAEYGSSKATILYHFESKDMILAELIGPLWARMGALATELSFLDDGAAQRLAVDRMTMIALDFRSDLAVFYGEIPELLGSAQFAEAKDASDRILAALVGRSTSAEAPIVARIVIGGVAAACHECRDAPRAVLQSAISRVMRAALTFAPQPQPSPHQ